MHDVARYFWRGQGLLILISRFFFSLSGFPLYTMPVHFKTPLFFRGTIYNFLKSYEPFLFFHVSRCSYLSATSTTRRSTGESSVIPPPSTAGVSTKTRGPRSRELPRMRSCPIAPRPNRRTSKVSITVKIIFFTFYYRHKSLHLRRLDFPTCLCNLTTFFSHLKINNVLCLVKLELQSLIDQHPSWYYAIYIIISTAVQGSLDVCGTY